MFAVYLPQANGYARFGSHRTMVVVDAPEKGHLFSRLSDAERRKNEINAHYMNHQLYNGTAVVHEIDFSHTIVAQH